MTTPTCWAGRQSTATVLRTAKVLGQVVLAAALLAGCATPPSAPSAPAAAAASTRGQSPDPSPGIEPWAADLEQLDAAVRSRHVSPFTIHTETDWEARLLEVQQLPVPSSPDEQLVLVASLVGMLDTHSAIVTIPDAHYYPLVLYPFTDGWFVVRTTDAALIGSRVVSIGGVAMDDVVTRLTPLVPHDNDSGLLEGLEWLVTSQEYLHGASIVSDPGNAAYVLERPDGTTVSVDPVAIGQAAWEQEPLATLGWLMGEAPEAVARRKEQIWTRLDEKHRAFLVSVNDYGDTRAAAAAMTASLDAGTADRVVLDMRYLRGGNGDIKIIETMAADPRINREGGLTVLIGRENVSAGTVVAHYLDTETRAVLVGEPTPARANNFLCECTSVVLKHSGIGIDLPTQMAGNDDTRPEIAPDVPMALSSTDFFAGRDPVLGAALAGTLPSSQP